MKVGTFLVFLCLAFAFIAIYTPGVPKGISGASHPEYDLVEIEFPIVRGFLFKAITALMNLGLIGDAILKDTYLKSLYSFLITQ